MLDFSRIASLPRPSAARLIPSGRCGSLTTINYNSNLRPRASGSSLPQPDAPQSARLLLRENQQIPGRDYNPAGELPPAEDFDEGSRQLDCLR
jgi:hypothetical protein